MPFTQWRFTLSFRRVVETLTTFLEKMDDKQISSLSVTHWNIKGLHDPIFGCKRQSANFLNSLNKHDINILTETWGCSHEVTVPNFETKIVPPIKIKNLGELQGV